MSTAKSETGYPSAVKARQILEKYQIDINDVENGIRLTPLQHSSTGLHREATQGIILERLQRAIKSSKNWSEGRSLVIDELAKIKALIKAGKFPPQ